MNTRTLTMRWLDGRGDTKVDQVVSLVAADASGQFGLLPGHEDFITVVEPGLFRYRQADEAQWRHAACAGGLLMCQTLQGATEVRMVSRRFLSGDTPEALQQTLSSMLSEEETLRLSTQDNLEQIDLALYKRLQELARS